MEKVNLGDMDFSPQLGGKKAFDQVHRARVDTNLLSLLIYNFKFMFNIYLFIKQSCRLYSGRKERR